MSYFICPCCNHKSEIFLATTGGVKEMCKQTQQKFLGALPIDPLFLKCCDKGIGFLKYCEDNDSKNDNESDSKTNAQENNNALKKNGNNANRQSLTYKSLIGLIDTIMSCISPELAKHVVKLRNETDEISMGRLQNQKKQATQNNMNEMNQNDTTGNVDNSNDISMAGQ